MLCLSEYSNYGGVILISGRRGVFSGTVENMHLHWKYRELVKIIVKAKTFDQVKKTALALESESGGVLVSVDKVSKGFAIVVFRGKDYQRPSTLRPKNLLTKRKALARSIELQRREVSPWYCIHVKIYSLITSWLAGYQVGIIHLICERIQPQNSISLNKGHLYPPFLTWFYICVFMCEGLYMHVVHVMCVIFGPSHGFPL